MTTGDTAQHICEGNWNRQAADRQTFHLEDASKKIRGFENNLFVQAIDVTTNQSSLLLSFPTQPKHFCSNSIKYNPLKSVKPTPSKNTWTQLFGQITIGKKPVNKNAKKLFTQFKTLSKIKTRKYWIFFVGNSIRPDKLFFFAESLYKNFEN